MKKKHHQLSSILSLSLSLPHCFHLLSFLSLILRAKRAFQWLSMRCLLLASPVSRWISWRQSFMKTGEWMHVQSDCLFRSACCLRFSRGSDLIDHLEMNERQIKEAWNFDNAFTGLLVTTTPWGGSDLNLTSSDRSKHLSFTSLLSSILVLPCPSDAHFLFLVEANQIENDPRIHFFTHFVFIILALSVIGLDVSVNNQESLFSVDALKHFEFDKYLQIPLSFSKLLAITFKALCVRQSLPGWREMNEKDFSSVFERSPHKLSILMRIYLSDECINHLRKRKDSSLMLGFMNFTTLDIRNK